MRKQCSNFTHKITHPKRRLLCIMYSTDGTTRYLALAPRAARPWRRFVHRTRPKKRNVKMSLTSSTLVTTVDATYGVAALRYENVVTSTNVFGIVKVKEVRDVFANMTRRLERPWLRSQIRLRLSSWRKCNTMCSSNLKNITPCIEGITVTTQN